MKPAGETVIQINHVGTFHAGSTSFVVFFPFFPLLNDPGAPSTRNSHPTSDII